MPFRVGPLEIAAVLILALLLFGPGRIANLGGELGKSISAFKKGLQGDENQASEESSADEEPSET